MSFNCRFFLNRFPVCLNLFVFLVLVTPCLVAVQSCMEWIPIKRRKKKLFVDFWHWVLVFCHILQSMFENTETTENFHEVIFQSIKAIYLILRAFLSFLCVQDTTIKVVTQNYQWAFTIIAWKWLFWLLNPKCT